jgi:hypothetical protein
LNADRSDHGQGIVDETRHLARGVVEPLRILDDADQRAFLGDLRQPAQRHRRAELVQPRVRRLHLRLDPGDLGDPTPGGLPDVCRPQSPYV